MWITNSANVQRDDDDDDDLHYCQEFEKIQEFFEWKISASIYY